MRKLVFLFFILAAMLLYCKPPPEDFTPEESNFPLEQAKVFPSTDAIQKVVSSGTWLAIYSEDNLTAIDINTQNILWQMAIEIEVFDDMGLQMVNDTLTAVTPHQVFLLTAQEKQKS